MYCSLGDRYYVERSEVDDKVVDEVVDEYLIVDSFY